MSDSNSAAPVLVVDETFQLVPDPAAVEATACPRRARDGQAFVVHAALRQLLSARHAAEVHLSSLLRLMVKSHGYRAWGHHGFPDYVMEELRQSSPRRFQDLVRIARAIEEGPLPRVGSAWRRGQLLVSQARELARVATPENEDEWLQAARSMSVRRLRGAVHRALRDPAAKMRPAADPLPVPPDHAGSSDPSDQDDEPALRMTFAATDPVDAAWQVFLETSRRMAGFDAPVHDCVDDLLAEYVSGCTLLPERPAGFGGAAEPMTVRDAGVWCSAGQDIAEAGMDLDRLRSTGREARLAVDPLQGLPADGEPDPQDLHRRIRWVLRVQQRVAWHEMRLVRLVAGTRLYVRLGFDSFARYAGEALDMSPRAAWSLVALARALDGLPHVAEAFRQGWITALEASSICRVAQGGTQLDWIARARTSTLQQLREEIAFVLAVGDSTRLPPSRPLPAGMRPCVEPEAERPDSSASSGDGGTLRGRRRGDQVQVQMCASRTSGTTSTTVAHRAEAWYTAFGDDPRRVAERMLAPRGGVRPVSFSAPVELAVAWRLALRDCRDRLSALARDAAAAACVSDSQCVAILLLNFLGQWAGREVLKASRALKVFTRDGWRCQAPRCRSRAHLNAHHIIFRSHKGPDDPWNLVTVCRGHHEMLHAGRIRLTGRAPGRLIWSMGVNSAGDVRERWCRGTRVASNAEWASVGPPPAVRAPDDWRAACDAA